MQRSFISRLEIRTLQTPTINSPSETPRKKPPKPTGETGRAIIINRRTALTIASKARVTAQQGRQESCVIYCVEPRALCFRSQKGLDAVHDGVTGAAHCKRYSSCMAFLLCCEKGEKPSKGQGALDASAYCSCVMQHHHINFSPSFLG